MAATDKYSLSFELLYRKERYSKFSIFYFVNAKMNKY